jgi:1-deoxy-D-xylulose-5-phosphate reductoisomerase
MGKFPCLRLAYEAVEAGGALPVALNAADEIAVAAFLDGLIRFDEIPRLIESVLAATKPGNLESISDVLEADCVSRLVAREFVEKQCIEKTAAGASPVPRAKSAH